MNSKGLIITGVAAGVAIAVFAVLHWRAPYIEPVERLKPLIGADKVFGSSIDANAASAPAAAAEEAPVAATTAAVEPAAPTPTPEPEPAAPVAEVVAPEPAAAPSVESTVAEAPAEAAPAAPAKIVKKKKKPVAQADALRAWWPLQPISGSLNLVYAGQVDGSNAIALMFDGSFADASGIATHVQVLDEKGKPVEGSWSLGRSTRLVSMPVPGKGRYSVMLKPGLADAKGRSLSAALNGPVYVQ